MILAFVPSFVYSTMHGLERPTVDDTHWNQDHRRTSYAIAWDMYQYTHRCRGQNRRCAHHVVAVHPILRLQGVDVHGRFAQQ